MEQLGDYRAVASQVKELVQARWPQARLYVFGSVVEGRYTAASDIDLLVVVDGVGREEAYRLKADVARTLDAPVELHIATRQELECWYKRFIGRLEEV